MDKEIWEKKAHDTVVEVAKANEEFTPDDIWDAGLEKPMEARWLGPVMNSAKRNGYIEKLGMCSQQDKKKVMVVM